MSDSSYVPTGWIAAQVFCLKKTKISSSARFSDGWADRPDVVEDIGKNALGGMSIKLYSPPIKNFDEYYQALKPSTNNRNPWFREFWQEKFECYITGVDRDPRFTKRCSGQGFFRQMSNHFDFFHCPGACSIR